MRPRKREPDPSRKHNRSRRGRLGLGVRRSGGELRPSPRRRPTRRGQARPSSDQREGQRHKRRPFGDRAKPSGTARAPKSRPEDLRRCARCVRRELLPGRTGRRLALRRLHEWPEPPSIERARAPRVVPADRVEIRRGYGPEPRRPPPKWGVADRGGSRRGPRRPLRLPTVPRGALPSRGLGCFAGAGYCATGGAPRVRTSTHDTTNLRGQGHG